MMDYIPPHVKFKKEVDWQRNATMLLIFVGALLAIQIFLGLYALSSNVEIAKMEAMEVIINERTKTFGWLKYNYGDKMAMGYYRFLQGGK